MLVLSGYLGILLIDHLDNLRLGHLLIQLWSKLLSWLVCLVNHIRLSLRLNQLIVL